jgi:uncharacterized repeat protein (TIGR03803 family)
MTSARQFAKKTAFSAITLALGLQAAAFPAPAAGAQRVFLSSNARPDTAHSVRVLHNFAGSDGSAPEGNLDLGIGIGSHSLTRTLYGTTGGGGAPSAGTIFSYILGSNVFALLYQFTGAADGGTPIEGLANNETNYFVAGQPQLGVTNDGGVVAGAAAQGTVYFIGANGQPVVLHTFTGGPDGGFPAGRPTLFLDGNYYGTTSTGGGFGFGTVYRVSRSGQFSTIYTFTGDSDGGSPQAGLALNVKLRDDATNPPGATSNASIEQMATSSKQCVSPYLYGTTSTGAPNGAGTVFRITPAGNLQTLYQFKGGLDGGAPKARLTSDFRGNLYGSASVGGIDGNGVIFKLAYNAAAPQVIHDFGDGTTGATPLAQITRGFNGNLYGTASQGGANGQGDVFKISRGKVFTDIHDFAGFDGANPQGGLVDGGDGKLYGTTTGGGTTFQGVLYSIPE